jgi:DNA-binding protein H-NS
MELRELLDKKVALDAEIAARRGEAVAAIRELMAASGVTVDDLAPSAPRAPSVKRPVKYRDADGNTWTGVGQRPRWLQKALAAGATLDQFAIR